MLSNSSRYGITSGDISGLQELANILGLQYGRKKINGRQVGTWRSFNLMTIPLEKTNALSCLMPSHNSRLQTLTSGPESYMNIKKSLSEIDLQRLVDSSPVRKAQVIRRKLLIR